MERGNHCSNSGASKASTLTEASEEIAHLKRKVQQLETELKRQGSDQQTLPSPITSSPSLHSAFISTGQDHDLGLKRYRDGIQFRPTRSSNETWFGPSSLYFFIQCLSKFLNLQLRKENPVHRLHPVSASYHKFLDVPDAGLLANLSCPWTPPREEVATAGVYLSLIQEDYFLNLYWQTYHTSLFPIVDETQFKNHYQSLLVDGGQGRRPSALVDIMIAMCMQYATSTMPAEIQGVLAEGKDALVAGRWHYWRGQKLLKYELDNPSLSTLQCHLLCAVYICGGSFHNMMNSTVGLAVSTAYMLGLHLDPPPTMSEKDREMRRRLWWAVYLMDSKAGMKLGRPFMLSNSYAMPSLPSDTLDAAVSSGSMFAPIGQNVTWLSYNLHMVQLYIKVRTAYSAFYDQYIYLQEGQALWADHEAQASSAGLLNTHTQSFQEWVDGVPESLKLKRQNNGQPISTDFTSIIFEPFTPPWLQRQRLLLEHTYHHLSINLCRPFISFTLKSPADSIAEELAIRCASHAIMLTMITHQALMESTLFDGWHEAFFCQWNAVMTLVGFVMLFPSSTISNQAKQAIELSISVFDNFGAKFPVAANAAKIVRDLFVKIEVLAKPSDLASNAAIIPQDFEASSSSSVSIDQSLSSHDPFDASEFNLFDMAVDIDFWNSVEALWPEFDNISQF
ncbi:hypothetical protein N7509_005903 [Penicillium cosmopolitanum]|uniref:Xylanolytic transcriptional activator regulatory domain-containing protein n=1 Tax=Penicillium cosmopolitanum TaxID=1131564 RepID=A0A9W9W336_9EURO|nr:uncharacterized protein N7509_005903 [Penicillium cosmopolitanum]KAJ5397790.1 hypothetical protein N7509_005903 [Penicillium cosmopolitanum]